MFQPRSSFVLVKSNLYPYNGISHYGGSLHNCVANVHRGVGPIPHVVFEHTRVQSEQDPGQELLSKLKSLTILQG